MSAQPILLDFKDRPRRGGIVGAVLMVLGVAGVVAVSFAYSGMMNDRLGNVVASMLNVFCHPAG